MVLTDEHRYPFSLFSESKDCKDCKSEKVGNVVSDTMDKTIGRAVVKIKGAVSANNYIDFSGLQLSGSFMCIQLCPIKSSIATMHIELATLQDVSLRITISTLYDVPRFLGRSLRLPLPFADKQGWTNVFLDLNQILAKYCQGSAPLKFVKRIQLCSNMSVRDVVTSNVDLRSTEGVPKELAVVPPAAHLLATLDLSADEYFLSALPPPLSSPGPQSPAIAGSPGRSRGPQRKSPQSQSQSQGQGQVQSAVRRTSGSASSVTEFASSSSSTTTVRKTTVTTLSSSSSSSSTMTSGGAKAQVQTSALSDSKASAEKRRQSPPSNHHTSATQQQQQQQHLVQPLRSPMYKAGNVAATTFSTPRESRSQRAAVPEPDTPDIVAMESTAPRTIGDSFQGHGQRAHRSAPSQSRLPQPKVLVPRRVNITTQSKIATATATDNATSAMSVSAPVSALGNTATSTALASTLAHTTKIVTPNKTVFNTPPADRVLGIERIMGYTGGPAALLYNGGMIALASGVMIVLVDVRLREAEPQGVKPAKSNPARYSTGLWKAFKSSTVTTGTENYPQAFLRGHTAPVAIIEVSMDGRLMVTCEAGVNAHLVLWDLQEGRRLAVLQPHAEAVQSVHFSPESTLLCTSGWDHLRRVQIILWDIPSVVQASSGSGNISKESTKGVVVARQLSDFHISKIVFSPFEEHSLVSCGRENIRFWRTRKGHLPGRPVQLGEYSRGYMFTDVTYVNAPPVSEESGSVNRIMGDRATVTNTSSGALRPCVFVASTAGLLLRVDCILEQVVCAYQLHSGPIRAMSINSAYAVTGGDDCKLRIWPLQFTDFLMEAFHEAAVSHVFVSQDARLLTVGTSSGTLGILDVFDHRYWTVLRSHVGAVLSVACRAPVGEEFLTVGRDNTIRLWDSLSGQQKFEFDSPLDAPLCGVYHSFDHVIACGFGSGTLRIFDVETTSTLFERSPQPQHATPLVALQYSSCPSVNNSNRKNQSAMTSYLLLYAVSLEGRLTVYDVKDSYAPLRTLCVTALLDNVRLSGIVAGAHAPTLGREKDIALFHRRNSAVQMSTSQDGRLLAVSCGTLYSLCIFDTNEMVAVFKGASLFNMPASDAHNQMNMTAGATTSSMAATMASMPRALDLGHGSATSPINCLSFEMNDVFQDSSSLSNKLFIVTDKRIICIVIPALPAAAIDSPPAVLGASYGVKITRDDISSRRLEVPVVPVAGAVAHDSASGLFFIAAKRKKDNAIAGESTLSEDDGMSDCLLVVGASVKPSRDGRTHRVREKVSLTCSQVMTDLPGDKCILSIAPCGSASNKIVMTDSGGCVSIWHMREDRIMKLKDQGSPIESDLYTPLENEDDVARHRPFGLHDLHADVTVTTSNLDNDFKETIYFSGSPDDIDGDKFDDSRRSGSSGGVLKESDMNAFFNVLDDDIDDVHDDDEPAAMSTVAESPRGEHTRADSSTHSSGILKSSTISPIKNSVSDLQQSRTTTTTKSSTRVTIQADSASSRRVKQTSTSTSKRETLDLNQSFGSDSEYVGQQMLEAEFCTEHFSDDDSVLDEEEVAGLNFDLGSAVEHAMTGSGKAAEGEILLQRIGIPPCFCPHDKTVVTSNGTQISVENINKGDISSAHQLLINPHNVTKFANNLDIRQVVRLASYAPSGLFIAAVVDVFHAPLHVSHSAIGAKAKAAAGGGRGLGGEGDGWVRAPSELHVWCRMSTAPSAPSVSSSSSADQEQEQEREGSTAWQHLGEVTLYTAGADQQASSSSTSLPATVSWTQDESLLLLVAVPIPKPQSLDLSTIGAATSPAQSGALLSITNWTDKLGYPLPSPTPSRYEDMSSPYVPAPTTPSIEMPGLPIILPFLTKPEGVKVINDWQGPCCDCAMAVWGDTKIAIYAINVNCHEAVTPIWVKDVGRSGPLLSVHLADYSHVFSNCTKKGHGVKIPNDNVVTSVHKDGGRSFSETTVITHPRVMENRADYNLTQSGMQNASKINTGKVLNSSKKQANDGMSSIPENTGCQCCDVIYRSYPLLMTLDSNGAINCSRLTFPVDFDEDYSRYSGANLSSVSSAQAQTPVSCVAKVSLAHVSGTPRSMTVSPCASILVLASVNCIQVFSVTVKDLPSVSFAVALTLRHKVVVPFSVDYVQYMPAAGRVAVSVVSGEPASRKNRHVTQVDILCAAKGGAMGVITSKTSSAEADKRHPITSSASKKDNSLTVVRCAPPFGRVDTVVSLVGTDKDCSKVAVLNKHSGEVALLNGESGKQIMSRLAGIHSSYSMAACNAFLAIGSRCGRMSVYINNDSMDLGQVVLLNAGGNSALMSSSAKSLKNTSEIFSNVTIKDLSIVSSGRSIVALRMDNTLFVIRVALLTKNAATPGGGNFSPAGGAVQVVASIRCQISVPLCLHTAPASVSQSECTLMKHEYHFVPCFGDDHLFGCVRGHTLHLYTIHDEHAEHHSGYASSQNVHHSNASSGKLPTSKLRVIRLASYRLAVYASDLFHSSQSDDVEEDSAQDISLRVQARGLHVVRLSGSTLQLTVVGVVEKSHSITHESTPIHFLFTGKVDIGVVTTAGGGDGGAVTEDIVMLQPCFSLGKVSSFCTTDRDFLGVVGHDGVRVYDIANVHVATRKILAAQNEVDVLHMRESRSRGGRAVRAKTFHHPFYERSSCRGVFQNTLQAASTISSHTWSQAVITLSRDPHKVKSRLAGSSAADGCMAFVHSTQINSPILYRIRFN